MAPFVCKAFRNNLSPNRKCYSLFHDIRQLRYTTLTTRRPMRTEKKHVCYANCIVNWYFTSAMLHVGRLAPNRPIGELCTNGRSDGALWCFMRFLCSSLFECEPKKAALGLNVSCCCCCCCGFVRRLLDRKQKWSELWLIPMSGNLEYFCYTP